MTNMNEMQIFKNEQFGEVRAVEMNGQPWFVGKDVAEILGYSNTKDAILSHVEEEDRTVLQRSENATFEIPNRGMTLINESGLYSLILSSKLPTAKQFKYWVTSEVLPSIRKHGVFLTDEKISEIMLTPEAGIRMLQEIIAERTKSKNLAATVALQEAKIAEMQPKASYYDSILQCSSTVPVTQIAKDYGMSARRMNQLLHGFGVQYKQGDTWHLYQKYANNGYTQSTTLIVGDEHSVTHTYWTQQGRVFLYKLLKQHGIVPMIERDNAHDTDCTDCSACDMGRTQDVLW